MIRRNQRGLSLVELMISLVIGLLIIAGVAQVFLGGRAAYNLQQRLGDLQENGRFALYFLQRDIAMAGFPKNAVPFINAFNPGAAGTFDGGGTASDQIALSYQGTSDCISQAAGPTVTNTFFIAVDPATQRGRLMCRGSGNAQSQPLVDGVENLQILYGEDMNADGYADRYVRASSVTNWTNVVAVRVAVLATSVNTVMGDTAAPTFQVLDASAVGPMPAGVRGRVFTTTIEVRNRTQ